MSHIPGHFDPVRQDLEPEFTEPTESSGPDTRVQDGWVWVRDFLGDWVPVGRAPEADGGRGASSSWTGQYVNDALTAASQAIQGFLSGQSLADARKLSSAEQFQKMAAFALPAGSTTAPGYERGGAAQQLAALQGRPTYTPPPIQTQHVNPAALAQAGQVPDEIMGFIQQMLDAAGQGTVVTTGGSSSS